MASIEMAPIDEWLDQLEKSGTGALPKLLSRPAGDQKAAGYSHTLREICQQPATWSETAARVAGHHELLERALSGAGIRERRGFLFFTGSGSSQFAGECLAPELQETLRVPVLAVASGALLTHPAATLPSGHPYLLVSFARSGNSPESVAVIDALTAPTARHLVVTCNKEGALARNYQDDPRVSLIVLSDATHDRSLVMTSSFTNMVLAASALGAVGELPAYRASSERVVAAARRVLERDADALSERARRGFDSVVYLGSGCRFGSAREAALKMLEMTGGQIWTMPESFLGLRHGPMAGIGPETLVVAHLASEPTARAYELDLLRELDRKRLGAGRVIVGCGVPSDVIAPGDVVVECGGKDVLADVTLTLIDALAGQLLAFFSCLRLGLRPDSPSTDGVIHRVVEEFAIHRRLGS